ncbi:MAG: succinylglutamate desuccinylase/aspartoacylase family protein [Burkholderiaceae bacterium]|nr:succinylglutamate desuccinylase/aspartoacylase family protein [Burkholderiaceae bacterium]
MHTKNHPLAGSSLGQQHQLTSFHYGPTDSGRKAYIQASLHADELPGMLVAHHLRQQLQQLEKADRLRAEIVIVPVANPIGLAQTLLRTPVGRFDLASGENFNRHYPALFEPLLPRLEGRLTDDAQANVQTIRGAMREHLQALPAPTELASLRRALMTLACDADVVLDLHCDCEAVLHLYTGTPLWPAVEPLARLLGAQASLLATASGDNPFDEACSQTWWQLQSHFEGRYPVPLACTSVTVELRGSLDVEQGQAAVDARALLAYLQHCGLLDQDGQDLALPPLLQPATALNAVEVLSSPISGVVSYHRQPGDAIAVGDCLADVTDALSGEVRQLRARTSGLLFARETLRYATAGRSLCKVAGQTPLRSGKLSSD